MTDEDLEVLKKVSITLSGVVLRELELRDKQEKQLTKAVEQSNNGIYEFSKFYEILQGRVVK